MRKRPGSEREAGRLEPEAPEIWRATSAPRQNLAYHFRVPAWSTEFRVGRAWGARFRLRSNEECENLAVRRQGSSGKARISLGGLLTGGDRRKLQNVDVVVDLVLRAPQRVEELLELLFSEDEIVRMRASDALEKVSREKPELLEPHLERLLTDVAAIDQPSVQWHLAQILGEVSLGKEQKVRARRILRRYLTSVDDWIVINLSLQTLAGFARDHPAAKPELISALRRHQDSRYKTVASRVKKLLAEFGD